MITTIIIAIIIAPTDQNNDNHYDHLDNTAVRGHEWAGEIGRDLTTEFGNLNTDVVN